MIPGKAVVSGGLARISRVAAIIALLVLVVFSRRAEAVPDFAAQTGQPCSMCHVGAFGPQLTPFGRAFKIGGYTQRGGEGLGSEIPLSLMVQGSFTHTSSGLEQDQIPHHFAANNNFSIDQVSLFLAGGIGEHAGGFMQFTYSPVDNTTHVDNTDLRPFTSVYSIGEHELRVGVTLNNNPTVQDPYNSTFAWGYPFIMSAIAPSPSASVMLASGFNNNVIGYSVYAWYDKSLYLEAGAYNTWSPWALARFGNDFGIGATTSPAPYLRGAYEWNWNGQSAHAGMIFMSSNVNPATGVPFQTNGSLGANRYTDLAVDGGYQFLGDDTHIVTLDAIYTYEWQNLGGTAASVNQANAANGTPTTSGPTYSLNELRLNASYWYQNTYGVTLGWQKVWGPANPVLYQPGELTGSANSKPNSNAFIIEADWVPFGKEGSWARPWVNLKLGVQLTLYTQFNGGTANYDGFGRNASANDTVFAFAWLAF